MRVHVISTVLNGPTGSIVMTQLAKETTKPVTTILPTKYAKTPLPSLPRLVPLAQAQLPISILIMDSGVTMMNRLMASVLILRFDSVVPKRMSDHAILRVTNGPSGLIVTIQLKLVIGKTKMVSQQMLFVVHQQPLRHR